MTHDHLIHLITSLLNITKEPVAMKVWKQAPPSVPQYQGNAFPGMCTQIAEALATGATFHTNRDHCFCTGGIVAFGVAQPPSAEEQEEIIAVHESISKGYKNLATAVCYEQHMAGTIPRVQETNEAVQVGLLKNIESPDLVLIFCTPKAADILSRAYCYLTGETVRGFGGNGGCPFLLQYPYTTKKPSFSYSDVAWRKYVGLADEELTVSYPYATLVQIAEVLPEIHAAYQRYGQPPEA